MQTIEGIVVKTFFTSPGWSAGILKGGNRFAGKLCVKEGDEVILTGKWVKNKYGNQFDVNKCEIQMPTSCEGIKKWIASNIKGLGPVKSQKLVDLCKKHNVSLEEAITFDHKNLAEDLGVNKEVINELYEKWTANESQNKIAAYLAQFDLTNHQIKTLLDYYGQSVINVLKENPYVIVNELKNYGFKKADVIARKLGIDKTCAYRIQAGIIYTINQELQNGHTWIELPELIEKANKLLIIDDLRSKKMIEKEIELMKIDERIVIKNVEIPLVALKWTYKQEAYIAGVIKEYGTWKSLVDQPDPKLLDKRLNQQQLDAVLATLNNPISVITGGAGTGKTFTIKNICDILKHEDMSFCLCAPTGKAAKRMEEATGYPASTIHRLLGYNGHEFQHPGPLSYDMIIIDEVSMVDIPLFYELISRIEFDSTNLCLVGDHNQLPPVGPGNILRDLVRNKIVPITCLKTVVRQSGILKKNCQKILQGEVATKSEKDHISIWEYMPNFKSSDELLILIEKLDPSRSQLLSPTRKGPLGVNALNILLQKQYQQKKFGIFVDITPPKKRPKFYEGDLVIQRRNNYKLEVMNGTLGTIDSIDHSSGIMEVVFESFTTNKKTKRVELERSEGHWLEIDLAYCLTIHQVQGSEFDHAIVICHKSHSWQNNRNLLYTGVTRAKKRATIIGDHWGIKTAAKKEETKKRRTWLSLIGI